MMIDAVTTMSPQAAAGKVRALATTGKTRSDVMPGTPTIAEAGVPGYEATIWLGDHRAEGHAAGGRQSAQRRDREDRRAAGREGRVGKQGAVAMAMTPDEFGKFLADDIVKWERIVRISGAKADR